MALHLMFPPMPAGVAEPTCLEEWLELTEADDDFLQSVFDYWDERGGPLVTIDSTSPIGIFLGPVVAARGGTGDTGGEGGTGGDGGGGEGGGGDGGGGDGGGGEGDGLSLIHI